MPGQEIADDDDVAASAKIIQAVTVRYTGAEGEESLKVTVPPANSWQMVSGFSHSDGETREKSGRRPLQYVEFE